MALTDREIKAAEPREKQYKLYDSEGLLLIVHPNGSKYWRLKYRYGAKEKMLALGVYPKVKLSEARKKRNEARLLIDDGIDPSTRKSKARADKDHTFERYFKDWMETRIELLTPAVTKRTYQRFYKSVIPIIGSMNVDDVTPRDIITIGKNCENRGALYTGKSIISLISKMYRWMIIHGITETDPAYRMTEAVKSYKVQNNPYLKENELPEFLKKLNGYSGYHVAKLATYFLLLTMVRTSEMRFSTWNEFDIDKAEWRIDTERMKMRRQHIVPLSRQTIAILEQLKPYSGGKGFVFPSIKGDGQPFSEVSVLTVIKRLGYKGRTTGHGFRATASTILNERGYRADAIERQLAHVEGGGVRAKYNHAEYLDERRAMMQEWADLLDAMNPHQHKAVTESNSEHRFLESV